MSALLLFIPDVPEFATISDMARSMPDCDVLGPTQGYHIIRSSAPISFDRRSLGLKPAVWYGIPTGGLVGKITRFDRDTLVIEPVA